MPVRSFDVADEEGEPIVLTYRSQQYRCRGHAPALPVLRGMRAQLDGELDEDASTEMVLEVVGAIFEDGELDRILRAGISMDKLWEISRKWGAILRGEVAEGEAMPPATGATTRPDPSSSDSSSSRPTSSASTSSTSGASSAAA